MKFSLNINQDGSGVVTIVDNGSTTMITDEHPQFANIAAAVTAGESPAKFLTNTPIQIDDDRVFVTANAVYFNGEPIHDNLTSTILRYQREGKPTTGLIKFLERLQANPSFRSRQQLFNWVQTRNLTIDEDGFFYGFKGVNETTFGVYDNSTERTFESLNSGAGVVDGEIFADSRLPQKIGSKVSLDRKLVSDDPDVACDAGLHLGVFNYAKGYGNTIIECKVDPADVVSVPRDSGGQKIRVCAYEVVKVHTPAKETERGKLVGYEPPASPEVEARWDSFVEAASPVIPKGFLARLRDRIANRTDSPDAE